MSRLFAALAALAVLVAGAALQPRRQVLRDASGVGAGPPDRERRWRWRPARARRDAIERDLPTAIDLVVLAVCAGHLPLAAIHSTLAHLPPSVQPAFAEVGRRCAAGERFADALAALPGALGPSAAQLADSLAAADRYGLPLAPVLDRLATEAHHRRRRRADALARQLPVRLATPLVVCILPSFVLLAVAPLLLAALSSLHR